MMAFCIAVAALCLAGTSLFAAPVQVAADTQALFQPNHDLLSVKIAVDSLADPSTNGQADGDDRHMAGDVRAVAGDNAKSADRLAALKRYLYEAGPWNNSIAFQYDQTDPIRQKPANRLLRHYLTIRRGNCITMPMLMVFIGERIGLKMTLASAPPHIFIKYSDDDGKVWNLEATSGGGFTRDVWYR